MAPVVMKLCGSAIIPWPAERAVIALEVLSTADTSVTACSKVTDTAKELQIIFETLSSADNSANPNCNAALSRWSMASLQTTPYVRRPGNRSGRITNRKLVFEASITFNIRVRNLDMLSRLATELSRVPLVKINKISWVLSDNTLAGSQMKLRKMATSDVGRPAESQGLRRSSWPAQCHSVGALRAAR
ncbi:hypothetical protein BDV97DRAFT_294673 [Delphinella strobiligena]|nr:hypothetical protein BDV97DRAFT_294673 [Delphinella strobiligena]